MKHNPSWETDRFSDSQEIPSFYSILMFITALTAARHLSSSWATLIQSTLPHSFLKTHFNFVLPSTPRYFQAIFFPHESSNKSVSTSPFYGFLWKFVTFGIHRVRWKRRIFFFFRSFFQISFKILRWGGRANAYSISMCIYMCVYIYIYVSQWKGFAHNHYNFTLEQDRHCTHNVIFRRDRLTIVVVEKQ